MSAPKKERSSSFVNFEKALKALQRDVRSPIQEPRDVGGIIKAFEMAYELSWKCLKKILESDGRQTTGPKDVFTKAYQTNYIDDEKIWLDMIEDRNDAAHVYSETDAKEIAERVSKKYVSAFEELAKLIAKK